MSFTSDLMGLGIAPAVATKLATPSFDGTVTAPAATVSGAVSTGALTCSTVNASGLATLSAGAALPAGQTVTTTTGGGAATAGTFVCNGTSNVTITTTAAAVKMIVLISLNTVGGTVGAIPKVTTITAGTSFTVAGTASDTSTYNWMILMTS